MSAVTRDAQRIDQCVAHQARLRPEAIALTCNGRTMDYRTLDARANQIAHRLRAMGIGPEDLVAVNLDRSIELVVALLACMRAGAAYLPLDPRYPAERVQFILEDARPRALLTSRSIASVRDDLVIPVLLLDDIAADFASEPVIDPQALADREGLAYVIYTSGSTGEPKGCLITHDNVLQLFTSTEHWFGFGPDDVWTFFHSCAFDFSVWEIWGALAHGGRVVVVPHEVSRSPTDFLSLLVRERVTVLNQTPSAFRALIAADQSRDASRLALRFVICGGESLDFQMLRPWFERYGDDRPLVINMYGITETTVFVTYRPVRKVDLMLPGRSLIGECIPGWGLLLLDEAQRPVGPGEVGELYVTGVGLGRGYLNRSVLNRQRFIELEVGSAAGGIRAYRSGDLARQGADGGLEYLGRNDHQVKISGYRIETGEIESHIGRYPGVKGVVVIARNHAEGEDARLVAYATWDGAGARHHALREYLQTRLPPYMVPAAFVSVNALPLTANGKLDREALPAPSRERPAMGVPFVEATEGLERIVAQAFAQVLEIDEVGARDNFFELGGSSLLAVRAVDLLRRQLARPMGIALLFTYATPQALAAELGGAMSAPSPTHASAHAPSAPAIAAPQLMREPIAIIGMACRLPGSGTVEQFWEHLLEGRELISRFSDESLDPDVPPDIRSQPGYVRARGLVENCEDFDAGLFNMPDREAALVDPQQRVFLELAWECLERAGYAPDRTGGNVGVFAGVGVGTYLRHHLSADPSLRTKAGDLSLQLSNDKDYVATRVAYKLNLKGPAVSVNTACSTSLVAIAQAVDSLRLGRCGMALAGGVSLTFPARSGHLHEEGAMLSKDGSTRTFDAAGSGTVFSDGGALVLLKPLSHAIADGDQIHALIRGIAINNDGGGKASFSAPSLEGQAAVIAAAQLDAGVDAASIGYVEAHGTATPLGDPVEMEALARAFGRNAAGPSHAGCLIGSVKSNIGHTVAAAGAAGVIKTALALSHGVIPRTLHYTTPNPRIEFARGPFRVAATRSDWPRATQPRRAAVSSFGVGGTNAHAVLEEAPVRAHPPGAAGPQLLMLSARSADALSVVEAALADQLVRSPDLALGDVAFTLHAGRSRFAHRAFIVAETAEDAAEVMRTRAQSARGTGVVPAAAPSVVWVFPGQGAQYAGMGRELYRQHEAFRDAIDDCARVFSTLLEGDLRQRMFDGSTEALTDTGFTQPAVFSLEYALACMWLSEGMRPAALIGHSIGEYAAAVVSGMMSLADAAQVVALRASLMSAQPAGSMASVRMPEARLRALLPAQLSIAAHNAPDNFVVSGPTDAVDALLQTLASEDVPARKLRTSHAFHSPMMEPVLAGMRAGLRQVPMVPPSMRLYSTLTGQRMADSAANDAEYWTRQLREPVLFSQALEHALRDGHTHFLEVGPGTTLAGLIRQHRSADQAAHAISTLGSDPAREQRSVLMARGHLWTLGLEPALPRAGRRVLLPTYPFERKRHALQAPASAISTGAAASTPQAIEAHPGHHPVKSATASMPTENSPTAVRTVRKTRFADRARELFAEVSGLEIDASAAPTPFMDLGLDSLMLTQAAQQIRRAFGVALTFRQLMESLTSIDALAAYLDEVVPPDPEAKPTVTAPVPGVEHTGGSAMMQAGGAFSAVPLMEAALAAVAGGGNGLLQQVIAQQMRIMNEQLEVLRSFNATRTSPPVAVAAAPATAVRYDVKKAFGAIARIHTQPAEITPQARVHLRSFIEQYVARTGRSKAYTTEHRGHLADPRVVNGFRPATKEITYQVVVERSRGSRVWDIDGNEYIDVLNGFGMNLFGWQPDFVQQAVRAQLEAGYEIGPQHPLAGEVAALVCELTGMDRAALCNTGSEAVMAAMRIARTVTGRNTIVVFSGSYHGTFDEVVVRAGRGGQGIPAAPGIMSGMFGDVRVLDYGTPESLEFIRAHIEEIAAVLVEPVQSRRPDFRPVDFLQQVRAATTHGGACLVFDEVITGFRAHPGGAQEVLGVQADLVTYGKVIGGGFPIGVVAGRRHCMDALDGGHWQFGDASIPTVGVTYFAGTFVRHPLTLAAAHAVLTHLRQAGPALQRELDAATTRFVTAVNEDCARAGAPLELRQFSSLWRVTWLADHPLQDLLFAMLRHRGVHILDNFPCFMTTAHSAQDMQQVREAFRDAVTQMQIWGLLPASVLRKAQ